MYTFVLSERVLTDNVLLIPDDCQFKGNYIAIVKEYSYATSRSDKEKITRFRKKSSLYKFLRKNYPEFDVFDVPLLNNYE